MNKHFKYGLILFALLAACILLFSCASKKKVTERYKNSETSKIDTETSKIEQKDQTSESGRISEYQQEIIKFLREFEIEPLDNSRPGDLNLKVEKDGSLTVTSNNAKAKGSAANETTTTTGKDSAASKSKDKGKVSEKAETNAQVSKNDKGRNSNSETSGFNWLTLFPVAGGLAMAFAAWLFYKRTGGK